MNLSLEERKITGDQTFTFDDVIIIINEKDFENFDHTQLDFVEDELGNGKFQLLTL